MRSAFGVEHIAKMGQAHLDAVRAASAAARRTFHSSTHREGATGEDYLASRRKLTTAIRAADAAGHSVDEIRAAGVHGGFASKHAIHRELGLPQPFLKPHQGNLFESR